MALTSSGSTVVTETSTGRTLTLAMTGSHISSVTDTASPPCSVRFSYDGAGNLTDVVDVNGGHSQFTYDAGHRLLTMREPKYFGDTTTTPSPVVTNHYDGSGQVDWQTDPLGRKTQFDYTSIAGSTVITDPKGKKTVDTYRDGELVCQTRGYGTADAATWMYSYDPMTVGLTTTTDPNGHQSTATYDSAGNRLTATDALGRKTTYTYNSLNQPSERRRL